MMDHRNYAGGRARCGCSGKSTQSAVSATRMAAQREVCAVMEQVPVMVYIVDHEWGNVYLPCRALTQGTLFPALDKPFFGKGGCACE